MTEMPNDILETYGANHLKHLLISNEHAFDLTQGGAERLLQIAKQSDADVIVGTNWDTMARDNLGESGDTPNYYAVGNIDWEVSSSRQAWLLKDGFVPQQEYLDRGDGRLTKARRLDRSDTDYVDEKGVCWFPKEYVMVCHPTDEAFEGV